MPSADTVERVLKKIHGSAANYHYFFSSLRSPEWIAPLLEAGLFRDPPPPRKEGDHLIYEPWPESRYLARMASKAPDAVLAAITAIHETDNFLVNHDIVNVALSMPVKYSVQLVNRLKSSVGPPTFLTMPEDVAKLCQKLADHGKNAEALELAGALLKVMPPAPSEDTDEGRLVAFRRSRGQFDPHTYDRVASALAPALARSVGVEWVELLAQLLVRALRHERLGKTEGFGDQSHHWYSAIEDDDNHRHDVKCILVAALRDAAEGVIKARSEEKARVLDTVRRVPFLVFERIELHLLRIFPDGCAERIAEIVGDREKYDDFRIDHEYRLLVAACFAALPGDIRQRYLEWVGEAADLEKDRRNEENDDAVLKRHRWRQLSRLYGLRDALAGDWMQKYDELVGELGEPQAPESAFTVSAQWIGRESPKSSEELVKMPVDELVAFLNSWEPPATPDGEPSKWGLAETVEQVVENDPDHYAESVEHLSSAPPEYAAAVVSAFEKACKSGRQFSWTNVLDLCSALIDAHDQADETADDAWRWCLKSIAALIGTGLESSEAPIPHELRERVRGLLGSLSEHPDPTPEQEQEDSNLSPETLSINSVRGEAMHATIRYALWVRRHLEADAPGETSRGFDAMPEVRAILDQHLDVDKDGSLAIRSVYGRWFPWLAMLDERWVRDNLQRICPAEDALSDFRAAFWETYVVFCHAFTGAYKLLEDVYHWATERLSAGTSEFGRLPRDPREALAEHLMVFYGRGVVPLEAPTLQAFWRNADGELRRHALSFVGHSFDPQQAEVPKETVERFKILCEDRIQAAQNKPDYVDDLAEFGWWFERSAFDVEWALQHLTQVIALTDGYIEGSTSLFKRLDDVMPRFPQRVLECVQRLVNGTRRGWSFVSWKDPLRSILVKGVQSDNSEVRELALSIVHKLGALGFYEFRDLARQG